MEGGGDVLQTLPVRVCSAHVRATLASRAHSLHLQHSLNGAIPCTYCSAKGPRTRLSKSLCESICSQEVEICETASSVRGDNGRTVVRITCRWSDQGVCVTPRQVQEILVI